MVLGHDVFTSERTQDIKITEDVSFDSMLLSACTLAGLKNSGYYVPSPIQLHGIPLGKCGFDLLLEAKSGTGKTAVFSVIALEKLSLDIGVQSIILAPTREIAFQICDVIKTIGAHYKGLCVEVVMGGLPFADDVEKFKKNVHIIVGSPGRLLYLIKGKHINVSSVRLMVLDEADKLVEKSFLADINHIFSMLPSQKQIIMSSATYPDKVKLLLNKYVQNAHHICPDSNSVLLGIDQNVIVVSGHFNIERQTKSRYEELNNILCKKQFKQCLIFCNYQVRVCEVHRMLNHDKWPADKLHGQQEQTDRLEALKILQSYQCRILVTTDLAARGIDASNIDLVINFEPPYDWQTYLHRIGRAGRYGSYGSAVTIICKEDEEIRFQKILQSIKIPLNLKYLWSGEPYLLEKLNIDEQINLKKEEMTPKEEYNKKAAQKLDIKETYEQLWNMLSEKITNKKPIDDIPSFESLNNSFQGSKVNVIDSFSDLVSSFQNHELQSKEHLQSMYKPVVVNKLIIPSMMLNRNDILESIQPKSGMSAVADDLEDKNDINNYENQNGFKRCESIDNKNAVRYNNSLRTSTKDSTPNKNWQSKYNSIESCSIDIHSETSCSSSDILTPGSSNKDIISKSNSNEFKGHCTSSIENTQKSDVNCNEYYYKKNENFHDGTDYNSKDGEFSIETDNPTNYNEDQKSLIAVNLPPAFGKMNKKKSKKSKKNKASFHESYSKENQHKVELHESVPSDVPPQESPYSSSSDEYSENVSGIPLNWKRFSQRNNDEMNTSMNDQRRSDYKNREMEERQQEFNVWCKQLQFYRQMMEQSIYIQLMSSSYN